MHIENQQKGSFREQCANSHPGRPGGMDVSSRWLRTGSGTLSFLFILWRKSITGEESSLPMKYTHASWNMPISEKPSFQELFNLLDSFWGLDNLSMNNFTGLRVALLIPSLWSGQGGGSSWAIFYSSAQLDMWILDVHMGGHAQGFQQPVLKVCELWWKCQ